MFLPREWYELDQQNDTLCTILHSGIRSRRLRTVARQACDELGIMVYHDMQYAQKGHFPQNNPIQAMPAWGCSPVCSAPRSPHPRLW